MERGEPTGFDHCFGLELVTGSWTGGGVDDIPSWTECFIVCVFFWGVHLSVNVMCGL